MNQRLRSLCKLVLIQRNGARGLIADVSNPTVGEGAPMGFQLPKGFFQLSKETLNNVGGACKFEVVSTSLKGSKSA